MIAFNLAGDNYHTLLQDLSGQLKVEPQHNTIIIPPDFGEGIIKAIQLPNKLQALMVKIFFNRDVMIKIGNTNEGDYVLHFDETVFPSSKKISEEERINSFVRLTGHKFQHWETLKKKASIQYVKILFSKSWLSNYIGLSEKMSVFERYIPIKSEAAEKEKLNEDYHKIINEMWKVEADDFLHNIFLQNRVLLLVELFFTSMHNEMLNRSKYRVTADDVVKLKKVESKLNRFKASPPNIAELAKSVSMSTGKLSQAFKEVYGTSVYTYYQNQRMQKAHELLSTKKFSVKEVGEKLGYTNLSNFVLAFKKEFDVAPKDLLQ